MEQFLKRKKNGFSWLPTGFRNDWNGQVYSVETPETLESNARK